MNVSGSNQLNASSLDINSIVAALTKSQDIKLQKKQAEQQSFQVNISNLAKMSSNVDNFKSTIDKVSNTNTDTITSEDMKKNIQKFVDAFNGMKNDTKSSVDYNTKMLTSKIRENLDVMEYQKLGLSFDKGGKLNFDTEKFDKNYTIDSVDTLSISKNLFSKVNSKPEIFSSILNSTGSLSQMTNTYNSKIKRNQQQQDQIVAEKDYATKNLYNQYSQLQVYLNNMSNKQNSLSMLFKA